MKTSWIGLAYKANGHGLALGSRLRNAICTAAKPSYARKRGIPIPGHQANSANPSKIITDHVNQDSVTEESVTWGLQDSYNKRLY